MTNEDKEYEFELKPFYFDKIDSKHHHTLILIGAPNSGKSTLARTIMSHFQDYPRGIVISKTEELAPIWENHVPQTCIYHDYDKNTLEPIIQKQREMIRKENYEKKIYGSDNVKRDNRLIICMDDVLEDDSLRQDKNLRTLFVNGRNYKIMLVLLLQAPITITPIQRACISFTFILAQNSKESKKKLFEYYCNCIDDYYDFITIYSKATANKGALVVDNCSLSENANDRLFWTKGDPNVEFKLFHQKFWDMDKIHKNSGNNKKQLQNLNDIKQKRKKHDIDNVDIRLRKKGE